MAPQRSSGPDAEPELPEYAGHYRLESRLGSGGMGVVHLARSGSGMRLAVKVVHAEFARDEEFRGRFRQEVAAARRVSGAFTAPVVDADPEAERPWMATMFIPGPTLAEEVKRNGPMAPGEVRRLMAGLAEALRDIHRVGVVHRDLKPGNVLLAEDGPKVIDFGISRPKDSELRTETGKLIGTPPFMAPEQFRRPREVGPAADVFALGSVIVHAAAGRGPFDSDSPYVVAYQVVHDEPDLTGVPGNLVPLVLRCLAKEPEDRPTPDELMRALRSVAASYDTQAFIPAQREVPPVEDAGDRAERAGSGEPGEEAAGRLRWWTRGRVALAAGALVLAGGAGITAVHWSGAERAPRVRPMATEDRITDWRSTPLTKGTGTPRCTYGSGELLCIAPGTAVGLDPRDGTVRWRRSFAGARWSDPPVVSGGLLQLRDQDGRVTALDPSSGETRLRRQLPRDTGTLYADGIRLVSDTDGRITGTDSASGRTVWQHALPDRAFPRLYAFGADTGAVTAYATTASADGSGTRVTALDPASGGRRWSAELSGVLQPVGAEGGFVYFLAADPVSGDTDAVVRYAVRSGAVRRVPLPAVARGARAVVRDGVVYLLSTDGGVDAVDAGAGKRLWHLETSVSWGSSPVADGRYLYFSAADGRLLAVDTRRGSLAGQTRPRFGARTDLVSSGVPVPVVARGAVYAAAPDGTVFARDTRDPSGW
ncbi:serine/threonine-protein kinase [Streptomyces sp. DSM 110735]|uniref:serine/threonine-protein kinase n=1 Tax=Streptomyces sp. DSM 110735 TaxID=2775031 RepID=UPI0018F5373C|nr:serine/threonine-protein kinase [Streptomyces sp. DSM 110735]MBJ7906728.1 serine/threonine-protein kinase [Streptomyces sp. DSM 110735]